MSCNICLEDYGVSYCNCTFSMCEICAKKHLETKNKDECPQCGKSLKTKHFFSGKICDKDDLKNISLNRIFVHKDNDHYPGILCGKHGLGRELEHGFNENQKVSYSDFISCDKKKRDYVKIDPADLDTFNQSVGPYILLIDETISNHGCIDWKGGSYGYMFDDETNEDDNGPDEVPTPFESIVDISETVIKRNTESIKACDVFTLKVNDDNDCFYSFVEWGQALEKKKILILDINPKNIKLKEYYLFAKQSILSLENYPFTRRECIIKNHPELTFESYKSYEKFMNHIINLKKGVFSSYP